MPGFALFLVSLCLAVNSLAQKPQLCTSPPQQVGSFSMAGPNGNLQLMGKYSYDALGNRVRFMQFGMKDGVPFHTDRLMLFQEEVSYEINWQTFRCKKRALETSFQPMQIPSNATLMGQAIAGSFSKPLQGLLVNTWVGELPEIQAKYMTTFTENGCLPLCTTYYTNETGYMSISFYNILYGIGNPHLFFPPAICESAELEGKTDFFGAFL